MDKISAELAGYLAQQLTLLPDGQRLLVGIAGVPASGKSTLAGLIVQDVNQTMRSTSQGPADERDIAVLVGLDGWHLTRAQLDAFPDPVYAHARRGAHWTFDGGAYVEFVKSLRQPIPPAQAEDAPTSAGVIYAPSFSHAIKDPSPDTISVHPHHKLVIIEGLYTFLSTKPWIDSGKILDERWWVEISEENAERRLVPRHLESGVAKDLEEAIWRSRENDAPNGRYIKENLIEPTKVIASVDDPTHSLKKGV